MGAIPMRIFSSYVYIARLVCYAVLCVGDGGGVEGHEKSDPLSRVLCSRDGCTARRWVDEYGHLTRSGRAEGS